MNEQMNANCEVGITIPFTEEENKLKEFRVVELRLTLSLN